MNHGNTRQDCIDHLWRDDAGVFSRFVLSMQSFTCLIQEEANRKAAEMKASCTKYNLSISRAPTQRDFPAAREGLVSFTEPEAN